MGIPKGYAVLSNNDETRFNTCRLQIHHGCHHSPSELFWVLPARRPPWVRSHSRPWIGHCQSRQKIRLALPPKITVKKVKDEKEEHVISEDTV
jgi:hypothetical protein